MPKAVNPLGVVVVVLVAMIPAPTPKGLKMSRYWKLHLHARWGYLKEREYTYNAIYLFNTADFAQEAALTGVLLRDHGAATHIRVKKQKCC